MKELFRSDIIKIKNEYLNSIRTNNVLISVN
jgi:hypothetical protein